MYHDINTSIFESSLYVCNIHLNMKKKHNNNNPTDMK